MPSQTLEVISKPGLHMTPVGQFVSMARAFPETAVRVRRDEREADGKSVVGMMALEALEGTVIEIVTEGPRADQVLHELIELLVTTSQGRRLP